MGDMCSAVSCKPLLIEAIITGQKKVHDMLEAVAKAARIDNQKS
jgi:hypothetical protein